MSLSRPLDVDRRKVERAQEFTRNLRSVVEKGNWGDDSSKPYAQLICENLNGILQEFSCSIGTIASQGEILGQNPAAQMTDQTVVAAAGNKRQRTDQNNATSKRDVAAGRKTQRMKIPTVTKKIDEADDGFKWKKYGRKDIKNEKYPRQYYACAKKGCPGKKQVQQIDDGNLKMMYFKEHDCKQHSTHPDNGINLEQNAEQDADDNGNWLDEMFEGVDDSTLLPLQATSP